MLNRLVLFGRFTWNRNRMHKTKMLPLTSAVFGSGLLACLIRAPRASWQGMLKRPLCQDLSYLLLTLLLPLPKEVGGSTAQKPNTSFPKLPRHVRIQMCNPNFGSALTIFPLSYGNYCMLYSKENTDIPKSYSKAQLLTLWSRLHEFESFWLALPVSFIWWVLIAI